MGDACGGVCDDDAVHGVDHEQRGGDAGVPDRDEHGGEAGCGPDAVCDHDHDGGVCVLRDADRVSDEPDGDVAWRV